MANDARPPLFTDSMRQQLLYQRILVLDGALDDDNGMLLTAQLLTDRKSTRLNSSHS